MQDDFSHSLEDRELFLEFLKTGTVWGIYYGMSEAEIRQKLGEPEMFWTEPYCMQPEMDIWEEILVRVYGIFEIYILAEDKVFGIGVVGAKFRLPIIEGGLVYTENEILEWFKNHQISWGNESEGFPLKLHSGVDFQYWVQNNLNGEKFISVSAEHFFSQKNEGNP